MRRDATCAALLASLAATWPPLPALGAAESAGPNREAELGRGAFAGVVKMRSVTGVERIGDASPLFKPGQVLDSVRSADGAAVDISFNFPEPWILAGEVGGRVPNLDVRDVKTADSAFLLAAPLPAGTSFERLSDAWFLDVIFASDGKYGAYGKVDDRRVVSSSLMPLSLPSGGEQTYRRLDLKFAPLSYNMNTVERRALISSTAVGKSAFILVAGCLAPRFARMKPELAELQQSFRALGVQRRPAQSEGAGLASRL